MIKEIRRATINEIYRLCSEAGKSFYVLPHFFDRWNIRANREEEALRCMIHAVKRTLKEPYGDRKKVNVSVEGMPHSDGTPHHHMFLLIYQDDFANGMKMLKMMTYAAQMRECDTPFFSDAAVKIFLKRKAKDSIQILKDQASLCLTTS